MHEIRPGSEFNISRTANKSGGSTYYINNRTASTNDVRNMLKANGIDLDHNRFLILQAGLLFHNIYSDNLGRS